MRYIVYGAGGIGGTIGAALHQAGHSVVLIARGAHLDAVQLTGLRLRTTDGDAVLDISAVGSPGEVDFGSGDVVLLAMKSQDTSAALADLVAAGAGDIPVICAQNGVENERMALRSFERVYGMCVLLPATHLEPGVIHAEGTPVFGVLDIGRYPGGVDDVVDTVVADLEGASFVARRDADVMGRKYRKLLRNLGNAVDALCGRSALRGELTDLATAEGAAVLAAAGVAVAEPSDGDATLMRIGEIEGHARQGSSTWQSLHKASRSTEVDFLNGEIVLLGRIHGVPTPVNTLLQRTLGEVARGGRPPGSVPESELLARLRG